MDDIDAGEQARPVGARPYISRLVAWALVPAPIVGWALAQLFTARIASSDEFTGALIHQGVASVFAITLLMSALINAALVTCRSIDRPAAYRFGLRGYLLWQTITLSFALLWVVAIAVGQDWLGIELIAGVAIVIASSGTFATTLLADPGFRARRSQRLSAIRIARSADQIRRRRQSRILALVALGAGLAAVVASEFVPGEIDGCEIHGSGWGTGGNSISTTCGTFWVGAGISEADVPLGETVDIHTLGWSLALAQSVFAPTIQRIAVELIPATGRNIGN